MEAKAEDVEEKISGSTLRPNDRVLAYHGPLIYEAKVLKIHEDNKSFVEDHEGKHESIEGSGLPDAYMGVRAYLVHYRGWKSKWDEWVTNNRILEWNETNIKKSRELKQRLKEEKEQQREKLKPKPKSESGPGRKRATSVESAGANSTPAAATPAIPTQQKRRKADVGDKSRGYEVAINIRKELKYLLVDDWEFVTKERKVIDVPAAKPVSTIIADYCNYKKAQKASRASLDAVDEVATGLIVYFNKSLGIMLLYKLERLQYFNLLKKNPDFTPSDIYGLEHLLRLFVSLPGLISQTTMDPTSINVLLAQCKDFLDYITDNLALYTNEYVNVSPAYDSLARS
ncbi:Piso0_002153 [Millerozyma farinosa CBS 7064]|uniref:Chromatin modification-related protein EAF3 n=1 Tax=Pichia sorbitophila (strain ATCC MYA-4447 / BCRC 22081 / CBS 7064 / NBRC 10061 / NRRL Y-12695) TaxID=559304 RepID=G8YBU6_PICSO|nr:Piso0_002153 [Millerozyma farinosa CBS 7064]